MEKVFQSTSDHANQAPQKNKPPTFQITQMTMDYLGGLIGQKAAAKFSKVHCGGWGGGGALATLLNTRLKMA